MNKLLVPINNEEFNSNVNIRFNNILDGLNSFKNFTIIANNIKDGEKKLIEFVEKTFEENNSEAYIDFYINRISIEDKKKLFELIPDEDKEILTSLLNSNNHEGLFYKLFNKSLIPFFVRLNTREIFFVTFYFTKKPITIWGNYNLTFPCFFNTEEDFKFYHTISKSFGLCD
jgi:hypothetical protein